MIGTLDVGGAERQLVEIASHLNRQFSPSVCCLSSEGPLADELKKAGVPVTSIGLKGIRSERGFGKLRALFSVPFGLVRFLRHVRREQPAILHGLLFHAYVLGAFAGRWNRVPAVVASRRSLGHFKNNRFVFRLAERLANRWTHLVIANSEAVRQDTLSAENLSADEVIVIHNGLDTSLYDRPADATLKEQLATAAGPVVVVVANLIGYKGHRFFLEAWARVCEKIPHATALLVGEGPVRGECEQQVRDLGLDDRVRFLGRRRDIPAILSIADLAVQPSLEEGFCNAILEAMAAGLPVVATDVGGNREAVADRETGVLVPPGDSKRLEAAMLDVLTSPDRGRAMGLAGRRRAADRFERTKMVAAYERVYLDLLKPQR